MRPGGGYRPKSLDVGVAQDTIAAYAATLKKGKTIMTRLIDTLASTIPEELKELRSLRTRTGLVRSRCNVTLLGEIERACSYIVGLGIGHGFYKRQRSCLTGT